MQMRFNASKTIARPQFRELMFQSYFDPETNRRYRGNPLLIDSEFVNAEGRFEWYFASEQHLSTAVFYKKIDRPIEAFTGFDDNTPVTSFANAPEADALRRRARTAEVLPARRHFRRRVLWLAPCRRDRQLHLHRFEVHRRTQRHGVGLRNDDAAGKQFLSRRQPTYRPVGSPRQPAARAGADRAAVPADTSCCRTRAIA